MDFGCVCCLEREKDGWMGFGVFTVWDGLVWVGLEGKVG